MIRSNLIKRRCENPKFVAVITEKGQPYYYEYKTKLGAIAGYFKQYIKNGKMDFEIKEYRSLPIWENI